MNSDDLDLFLNQNKTCVIARVNPSGGASAATVGFSHDKKMQFLIATNDSTRKYNDIINNENVALVVGFEPMWTVQLEGTAKEFSAEELGERLEQHFEKVPGARNFAGEQGQRYFLITPNWLRFSDISDPSKTLEMREFNEI